MSKYALAGFLALYGVTVIFETYIPTWAVGVLAWAAAAVLASEAFKGQK